MMYQARLCVSKVENLSSRLFIPIVVARLMLHIRLRAALISYA